MGRHSPLDDLAADDMVLSAIKYRFATVIECCARVAHHLSASEGWGIPETNADALRELARRAVITGPLPPDIQTRLDNLGDSGTN